MHLLLVIGLKSSPAAYFMLANFTGANITLAVCFIS